MEMVRISLSDIRQFCSRRLCKHIGKTFWEKDDEQFLLLPQCFHKSSASKASECVFKCGEALIKQSFRIILCSGYCEPNVTIEKPQTIDRLNFAPSEDLDQPAGLSHIPESSRLRPTID